MSTFTARYPGECGNCGGRIRPDDECAYAADTVVHATCPPDPTVAGDICGRCFTELPATGVCGVCE